MEGKIGSNMAEQEQVQKGLIVRVTAFVKGYMDRFDGSHDFSHILRVLGNAHHILSTLRNAHSPLYDETASRLDETAITLAALMHDVGDRKYLRQGEDPSTLVLHKLLELGAAPSLAEKVQTICTNVSWTQEQKDPSHTKAIIKKFPELAVVQDADRLDSIGAVGIGRVFTFGGAKTRRRMRESAEIFEGKLLKIEAQMKTEAGKEIARHYTERLKDFKHWWDEEMGREEDGESILIGIGVHDEVFAKKMVEDESFIDGHKA